MLAAQQLSKYRPNHDRPRASRRQYARTLLPSVSHRPIPLGLPLQRWDQQQTLKTTEGRFAG
jgi:hypothetical protein